MAVTWKKLCFESDAVLINGRSGGQTISGGTSYNEDLVLRSNSIASAGKVIVKDTEFCIQDFFSATKELAFDASLLSARRTASFPDSSGTVLYDVTVTYTTYSLTNTNLVATRVANESLVVSNGGSSVMSAIYIGSGGAFNGMIKDLYFHDSITVTHNASVIKLRGAVNADFNAGDVLSLGYSAGVWCERFRTLF